MTDTRGSLLANLMHFARALRTAGLPVGPGKVIDAVAAVRSVGITDRRDFYWTLHAVLVNRPDQRLIFDQAFHVFWRNPDLLRKMMGLVLPEFRIDEEEDPRTAMARRLAEALHPDKGEKRGEAEEPETELDAAMTFSDREQLRGMDFERMSLEELARAKAAIARLRLPVQDVPTRRFAPDRHGSRADLRATFRAALRSGGLIELKRRSPRRRPPPLVVLCDISGSMSRYSRIFLHFMHSVTNDRDRVHTFVFGTRLTNITRYLRHRDVDLALEQVAEAVVDCELGADRARRGTPGGDDGRQRHPRSRLAPSSRLFEDFRRIAHAALSSFSCLAEAAVPRRAIGALSTSIKVSRLSRLCTGRNSSTNGIIAFMPSDLGSKPS